MAACAWCGEEFDAMRHRHACKYCSQECFRLGKSNTLPDGMRRCGQCGEAKPETDEHFYRKRDRRRGRTGWTNDCRPCRAKAKLELARARGRRSKEEYRATLGAHQRGGRVVASEVAAIRALARKKMARWRALYLRENPDCRGMNKNALDWRVRYAYDPIFRAKEIMKARAKDSLANELSDGTLDARRVAALFAMARKCPYCEGTMRPGDKRLDHVRPLSRSGPHSIQNVVVCCATCNQSKLDADPVLWIRRKWPGESGDATWRRVMGQVEYNQWVTPSPKARSVQRMGVQVAA